MSPSREEQIVLLKTDIEKLDRSLDRWRDTSMPAYGRPIKRKQELTLALDRLELMKVVREGRAIGRNIDSLRKECGWSLEQLAKETGIDKKSIISHRNKGVRPRPRLLKEYAQAFSKALGRKIIATDLEK